MTVGRAALRAAATFCALMAVAAAWATEPASARIQPQKTVIDVEARLDTKPKILSLTGRIGCDGCEGYTVGVTVTQRRSGALAQGGVICKCPGSASTWLVRARIRGDGRLVEGPARACAWAISRGEGGRPTDALQWCRTVRVVA
jgi:hypothetical protein